ncbi:hemicentin-1-like [Lineus longissimus]|uniref:hemicentin-1-like n=1 Tax=Lineus longissimus TaxID=88925 RepID=UPI002B4FA223
MATLTLFLALVVVAYARGESGILHPGPRTVSATPGQKVVLDCVIVDAGGDKVLWMKGDDKEVVAINGMQLMIEPNINVVTIDTNEGTNYQLTINKFSGQYADVYYCLLDRGEADWNSKQKAVFTVQADVPESPPQVSTPRLLGFEEGTTAKLKCTVKNFSGQSIMWLKRPKIEAVSSDLLSIGKTIYFKDTKSKYKVEVENVDDSTREVTLTINSILPEDAGNFACSVQVLGMDFNDYPSSEVTVTVKEKEIPKPKQCYWKAFENSRLPNVSSAQYRKIVGPPSTLECMARCRNEPGCKSISYNSKAFTCYVMQVSSGGDMSKIGPVRNFLYAELFC